MFLKKIYLSNFRNYENTELLFNTDNNVNIICAPNGMGKSNLLESIYYMSYLRPFRPVLDRDLIKKNASNFLLYSEYEKNGLYGNIEIKYSSKKKDIFLDKKKVIKHSELLGKLLTVLFSNDDLFIINGNPSIKRRFFNMFFSVIDPLYLEHLKKYDLLIKQKNKILKDRNYNLLCLFDEQISYSISYIQNVRQNLLSLISSMFSEAYNVIGFYSEKVSIKYNPSLKLQDITPENILKKINEENKTNIEKGFCVSGPHKDDFLFYINNILFSRYGSFGQLRLASLVLKHVQSEYYKKKFNTNPIYLLDDVILELDKERQSKFIEYLGYNNQLFITVTDKEYAKLFKANCNIIGVNNGKIL